MKRFIALGVGLCAGLCLAGSAAHAEVNSPDGTEKPMVWGPVADSASSRVKAQAIMAQLGKPEVRTPERLVDILIGLRLPPNEGVPVFSQLLEHPLPIVRYKALWILGGQYGTQAASAVPRVVQLLGDAGSPEIVVMAAARALGLIRLAVPGAIQSLTQRLDQAAAFGVQTKTNLLQALGAFAAVAKDAEPVILKMLEDPQTAVQSVAFDTWGLVAPVSLNGGAMPTLTAETLTNLSPVQVRLVLGLLAANSPHSDDNLLWLEQLYQTDSRPYVRCAIVKAIGSGLNGSERLIPILLRAAGSDDDYLADLALQALSAVDVGASPAALNALVVGLSEPKDRVKQLTALILKRLGARAASAVPALTAALAQSNSNTDEQVLAAYLDALRAIGPAAGGASQTMTDLLPEQSEIYQNRSESVAHHLQAYLLGTLAQVGVPASALPFILDGLANSDASMPEVYAGAARAAGALGPEGREAIPFLLRALKPDFRNDFVNLDDYSAHHTVTGEFTTCRIEAIRALAKMGPAARDAAALLAEIVQREPDLPENPARLQHVPNVAREARTALASIQTK